MPTSACAERSSLSHTVPLILSGLLMVAAVACSSNGGGGTGNLHPALCVPGQSVACVGPGGCSGYQTCTADGTSYEACVCGSESSSSTSSGVSSSSATSSSSSGGSSCTNLLQGSFTVQNSADIATLASYCGITGDLTIATSGVPSISLPTITTIGVQLVLQVNGLSRLTMPALTKIGSRMLSDSAQIDELDFPELSSVGSIEVPGKLKTLNVPKLNSVPGSMSMSFDPSANISFPSLISVGAKAPGLPLVFHIVGGASISAPVLNDCKFVALGGQTTSVDLPAITSLDVFGYCAASGDCSTSTPTSTPTITMNALTSITDIELMLPGSPHVSFPNLASIGHGHIEIAVGGFSAPNLKSFGTPYKGNIISADSFSAPKLTSLDGITIVSSVSSVDLGALQSLNNLTLSRTKLTELDLPALTSGEIALSSYGCLKGSPDDCSTNPQLLQFKAPKWTSGKASFADSTFPACRASAICAQLGQSPSAGSCWCDVPAICKQATSPCP